MTNKRPHINMSAPMMQDLPPAFTTAVQIAGRNIDAEVDKVMDKYEAYLEEEVTKLSDADFKAKAQAAIDTAMTEFDSDVQVLANLTKTITDKQKALNETIEAMDGTNDALSVAADALQQDVTNLTTKIAEVEKKAGTLGSQLGTLGGTAIKGAVKSILPF